MPKKEEVKKIELSELWGQMTPRERKITLDNTTLEKEETRRLSKRDWWSLDMGLRDVLEANNKLKTLISEADLIKIKNRQARKLEKKRSKEFTIIKTHKNQKPVKSITINIEWKKSYMWGHNPHATATVEHHDGTFSYIEGVNCSGCGYDKESTVIADIFNQALRYELYRKIRTKKEQPYGFYYYGGGFDDMGEYLRKPCYNGGVGTSCYYRIAEFIGGKFEHISGGKSFDVYKYTDKKKKRKIKKAA